MDCGRGSNSSKSKGMILFYSALMRQHLVLCSFWDPPVQKRWTYCRESRAGSWKQLRNWNIWHSRRGWEIWGSKSGKEKPEEDLINMCKHWWGGVKKMEPDFFQCCLNKRQEATGTKLSIESLSNPKKNLFYCAGDQKTEQAVQRCSRVFILGDIQNPSGQVFSVYIRPLGIYALPLCMGSWKNSSHICQKRKGKTC